MRVRVREADLVAVSVNTFVLVIVITSDNVYAEGVSGRSLERVSVEESVF